MAISAADLVDERSAEVASTVVKSNSDLGFEMDFTYEPTNENPICKLGDHRVLSLGNMQTLVAPPGQGKSHVSEAFISNWIDSDADAFGFIFAPPEDRKTVIHIDTERTKNDCYYAYLRIAKRIKPEYKNNERIQNLIFKSFIDIDSIEARLRTFDHLVSSHPVGLVIIDGLTDLILNTNDEEQSKKLITHLLAKANEYQFGLIVTIHKNPRDPTDKPRGHIGSEAYRKSESMFSIRRAPNEKDIRLITTDFEHGKNRNGYDLLETAFTWDTERGMFTGCDYVPVTNTKQIDYAELASKAFESDMILTYSELKRKLHEIEGKSPSTARDRIKDLTELEYIKKDDNGNYRQSL